MTASLHRLPVGRTMHVIDIENLAGGSGVGAAGVRNAVAAYRATVDVRTGDHVVIGSGRTLAFVAKATWPAACLRIGRGVDGADNALLEDLDCGFVAAHYDRVVIASGDHAFAGLVAALRAKRVAVLVVGRNRSTVSAELRRLAPVRVLASAGDYALAS